MDKSISLLNDVIKNMQYIKLLLTEGHEYIPPLNTYYLTMDKLNELKSILIDKGE